MAVPTSDWSAGCHLLLQVNKRLIYFINAVDAFKYLQVNTWFYYLSGLKYMLSERFYVCRSSDTTQACKQGRSATIRLRCSPTVSAKDHVTLPGYFKLLIQQVSSFYTCIIFSSHILHQRMSSLWLNCGLISPSSFKIVKANQSVFFLQQLLRRNVRRLFFPLSVAEPARVSTLHQRALQRDRQCLYPGNTGNAFTAMDTA